MKLVPKSVVEAEQSGPWNTAIVGFFRGQKSYLDVDVGAIDSVWMWQPILPGSTPRCLWSKAKALWIVNNCADELNATNLQIKMK